MMPYKNPEKQREADRRWREANPEKVRETSCRWREANLETARARRGYRTTRAELLSGRRAG